MPTIEKKYDAAPSTIVSGGIAQSGAPAAGYQMGFATGPEAIFAGPWKPFGPSVGVSFRMLLKAGSPALTPFSEFKERFCRLILALK